MTSKTLLTALSLGCMCICFDGCKKHEAPEESKPPVQQTGHMTFSKFIPNANLRYGPATQEPLGWGFDACQFRGSPRTTEQNSEVQ